MDKAKLKNQFQLLKESEALCQERHKKSIELCSLLEESASSTLRQQELKKEIKELDHLLDTLTHEEEVQQEVIMEEMAREILTYNPSSHYEELKKEEILLKKRKEELTKLSSFIEKYHQIFSKGSQLLRRSSKSWLAMLFGRHPKVLLSYEIGRIAKEGDHDLALLTSLPLSNDREKELRRQLLLLLTEVAHEAKKAWNHALYEESFHHFFEKSNILYQKLTIIRDHVESQHLLLVQKKEHWIEDQLK